MSSPPNGPWQPAATAVPELALRGAPVCRRVPATLIDLLIVGAVVFGLTWLLGDRGACDADSVVRLTFAVADETRALCGGSAALVIVGVLVGYFLLFELLFAATLGMLMTGLRVVGTSGGRETPGQAVVRSVLVLIDGVLIFAVAAIVVGVTRSNQRIGDLAARTYVVPRRDLVGR